MRRSVLPVLGLLIVGCSALSPLVTTVAAAEPSSSSTSSPASAGQET